MTSIFPTRMLRPPPSPSSLQSLHGVSENSSIDCSKEISNCIVSDNPNLRYAIVETLGCLLARDDVVNLCVTSAALLDRVSTWWRQIGESMLHPSDAVSRIAFEGVGRLFLEFSTKRLSRLAGDKLVPSEDSLAIRAGWLGSMCRFVWEKRDFLMARSRVLTTESFRASVFPLVFSAKAVATGMVEDMQVWSLSLFLTHTPPTHRSPHIQNWADAVNIYFVMRIVVLGGLQELDTKKARLLLPWKWKIPFVNIYMKGHSLSDFMSSGVAFQYWDDSPCSRAFHKFHTVSSVLLSCATIVQSASSSLSLSPSPCLPLHFREVHFQVLWRDSLSALTTGYFFYESGCRVHFQALYHTIKNVRTSFPFSLYHNLHRPLPLALTNVWRLKNESQLHSFFHLFSQLQSNTGTWENSIVL